MTSAPPLTTEPAARSLSVQELSNIGTYCMFVGYPRSGHSLIGSLLDAHPNIVIAHELNALKFIKAGGTREQIFNLLMEKSRGFATAGLNWNGYTYAVPNQWQGRFRKLHVIGDKKGGLSSMALLRTPQLLDALLRMTGIPTRFIHVIRNPYDNIATLSKHEGKTLPGAVAMYFAMAESIAVLKARAGAFNVYDLRHEDFVAAPQQHLAALCRFLGEDASEDYLTDCAAIVHPTPHQSRVSIDWPMPVLAHIQEQIQRYPFLAGYAFDN